MTTGPRSLVRQIDDRVIHVHSRVGLSPREAYRHFIAPGLLASWLTVKASVEPHVGGRYELFWDPNDLENNSTIGCRITALSADELVAFQWRCPVEFKSFANGANPLTHVVVTFHRVDDGTQIHLLHSGWRDSNEWERARAWQERAWTDAFQRLLSASP
jgi:hypothetical protein